jgi:GntR family transcriptional regulator
MKLSIGRNAPLGLKEQIKRQIKSLIQSGQLPAGQSMPSAKDLAAALNVNRNTAAAAYKELAAEGWVNVAVGSGTSVREGLALEGVEELAGIFDRAMGQARALGFDAASVTDYLWGRLLAKEPSTQGRRVLVVDCNQEVIEHISGTLVRELGVTTRGVLIQTLEENRVRAREFVDDTDLVVVGFNHVEEFRRAVPDCPSEVVAVMLKTEVHLINEIVNLPPGTRVGYVCANQRSTETYYKNAPFSGGSGLIRIWAGLDNPDGLQEILATCDTIFVTKYAFAQVKRLAGPDKRLTMVDLSIEPAVIDLIRERLAVQDDFGSGPR